MIIIICIFCKRENQGTELDGELKLEAETALPACSRLLSPCCLSSLLRSRRLGRRLGWIEKLAQELYLEHFVQMAAWPELAAGREGEGAGSRLGRAACNLKPWLLRFLGCRGLKEGTVHASGWGQRGLLRHRASSLHTCVVVGSHVAE